MIYRLNKTPGAYSPEAVPHPVALPVKVYQLLKIIDVSELWIPLLNLLDIAFILSVSMLKL